MHGEVHRAALWYLQPTASFDSFRRAQRIAVAVFVYQMTVFRERKSLPLFISDGEMYGGSRIRENHFTCFQLTIEHIDAGHRLRVLNGLIHFCLDTHAEQGEQDGDDG